MDRDEVEHVTFLAAFPNIQCIKYQGDGGARMVLDIPESDIEAVDKLRRWRNVMLMVTVCPVKEDGGNNNPADRTAAKKRI